MGDLGLYKWVIFLGLLAVAIFGIWIFYVTREGGLQEQRRLETPESLMDRERKKAASRPTPPPQQAPVVNEPPMPKISSGSSSGEGQEKEYFTIDGDSRGEFHRPGCAQLQSVPRNKLISHSSRRGAADGGYVPCPNCRP